MKKLIIAILALFMTSSLFTACTTTGTSKPKFTSPQDLFERVPEDKKQAAAKANETLQKANKDLELSSEKLHLAKLQEELTEKYEKLAEYELKLAEAARQKAVIGIDYARWEAIDNAGLGDPRKNIKTLSGMRKNIAKIDTDIIGIDEKIRMTQVDVSDLVQAIKAQKEKVSVMEPGTAKFERFRDFLKDLMK